MKTTLQGLSAKITNLEKPPLHIPDGKGGTYKTELVLFSSPERTEKVNWWHGDDPRQEPHNHPWKNNEGVSFVSTILKGGYTERKTETLNGEWSNYIVSKYGEGDKNIVKHNEFHVVYDVLPNTVTHMVCYDQVENNEWGYLDLETMEYVKAEKDPEFFKNLCNQNSFMLK